MISYRLPYALPTENNVELSLEECLALNFMQIVKRVKNSETLIRYSMIYWPMILIQAEPDYKLIIDKVGASNQSFLVLNAPRNAQIGHILRKKGKNYVEKLDSIYKIINYHTLSEKDLEETEFSAHEQEYLSKKILGLFPPDFIQGIGKIIQYQIPFNIEQNQILDSIFNFDQSMAIAQSWFQLLKETNGNITRWNSLDDMISNPVNEWHKELVVKLKDQEELFDKAIRNTVNLDEHKIKEQIDKQKDVMDSWVLQEQKAMSEKIGKMFKGIDLIFEDVRTRNKFFLNTDLIRVKPVGEVVMNAYQNIAHIRSALEKTEEELYQISQKINSIRKDLEHTNLSADEKIQLFNLELQNKKYQQEEEIRKLKQEKERKIRNLSEYKNQISSKLQEIQNSILEKINECRKTLQFIRAHQITDKITKITTPTHIIHMPVAIGIIEDEDFDERIECVLPSKFDSNFERELLFESCNTFENNLRELLDSDMKLRSNFEFTVENAPNYKILTKKGLEMLDKKGTFSQDELNKYLELLN